MSTTVEYILEIDSKGAQAGLKQTDQQVQKTTSSLKNMRAQARGMSGSFQAVGEAANFLAPELTGLADVAVAGARTFRGLGRALASGNPIIIGLTVAIGAAIAAYAAFNAANKREEESLKALNKTLDENTKKIQENQSAYDNAEKAILTSAGKLNDLRLEYALLSGDISKAEEAELKRSFAAEQAASSLDTQLQNQVQAKKDSLKLAQDNVKAAKDRIAFLQSEGEFLARGGVLTAKGIEARKQEEAALRAVQVIERDLLDLRTDGAERIKAQSDEYLQLQDAIGRKNEENRKREEAIARSKERQTQLQGILNSLTSQAGSLASRLLDIQIARMAPADQVNAQYEKEIANLTKTEREIIKQFEAAQQVARSKNDLVKLTEIQAQKEAALANIQALKDEAGITAQKQIGALAGKNIKVQVKGFADIGKITNGVLDRQIKAQQEIGRIVGEANDDQLTALDRINNAEQERLKTLQDIATQQGINTQEAQDAVKARAARERAAERQRQTAQAVGIGETVITAAMDPNALIGAAGSAFGPVGEAVAGVVGALSALGQADPEQIKQQFRATFEGIAQGIKVLVPLLIEMLPSILFDAAGMIINALIQLPFTIVAYLAKAIQDLFKGIFDFFRDPIGNLGKAFAGMIEKLGELITQPFANLFGGSKMGGGRMLSGQGGLRFTGANRGLAMLHEGEMVVPRSGQMSSSVARDVSNAMGGGGVSITINSAITERSAIDDLVRKIEQRFGAFGQSKSTLFGGA